MKTTIFASKNDVVVPVWRKRRVADVESTYDVPAIKLKDSRKFFISSFYPAALSWNRRNWQNSMLKYVEAI